MSIHKQALNRATGRNSKLFLLAKLGLAVWGLAALGSSALGQSSVLLAWSPSSDSSVVGYRLYQGGVSHVYTNVVDVGNTTSNLVSGLTVGATYYFAVTAYGVSGLESPFSNEISYTVLAPVAPIGLAASAGTMTAPFAVNNGVVSQSVLTGVTNGGRAAYSFTVNYPGAYTLWGQVAAPTESANSVYLNIDAEPTDPTMIWDIHPLSTNLASRIVTWRGNGTDIAPQYTPAVFKLSAGTHQLIVRGREANTQLGALTLVPYVQITNCCYLATGNRTIHGSGVANAKYVLFASSSLTAPVWSAVSTNTADAQGVFAVNDLAATNYPCRFYRIQAQ